jgi:hypothetical protein
MESRRRVKFTDVEFAAPVEKAVAGRFGGEGGPAGWGAEEKWSTILAEDAT